MIINVEQHRSGHLSIVPVSERKQKEVKNASYSGEYDLYLQGEQEIESFIEEYVPPNKREYLDQGWAIKIEIEDGTFIAMLGANEP